MVGYIIGRRTQDLELPDLKAMPPEAQKKRAEVNTSIKIFDQVSFVMKDNEQKNKEAMPVETILTVIAGENRYAAENSQDEAAKAEHAQWASLADEWAGSYAKRKERLENERAEAEKKAENAEASAPTDNAEALAPAGNAEPGAAPMTQADNAAMEANPGVQNAVTDGANLTPANAGETTQTLTVPLSTEGIV